MPARSMFKCLEHGRDLEQQKQDLFMYDLCSVVSISVIEKPQKVQQYFWDRLSNSIEKTSPEIKENRKKLEELMIDDPKDIFSNLKKVEDLMIRTGSGRG